MMEVYTSSVLKASYYIFSNTHCCLCLTYGYSVTVEVMSDSSNFLICIKCCAKFTLCVVKRFLGWMQHFFYHGHHPNLHYHIFIIVPIIILVVKYSKVYHWFNLDTREITKPEQCLPSCPHGIVQCLYTLNQFDVTHWISYWVTL